MQEHDIRLTPNMMRTIGESTKLGILRMLSSGPRIPTDIATKLNKSAPTIVEHLEKLRAAGLVDKREQPGKKYVFYALTQTGMELVSSKSKVSLALYGSIVLFVAGIFLFGLQAYSNTYFGSIQTAAPVSQPYAAQSAVAVQQSHLYLALLSIITIVVLICGFALLLMYALKMRKMKIAIGE